MKRKPLKRKTPLKKRNNKRRKKLWKKQFGSVERLEWLKSHPCVCGRPSQHAHHVVSRGAGGTKETMVPLCADCHTTIHNSGDSDYEDSQGVDLKELARRYAEAFEARGKQLEG